MPRPFNINLRQTGRSRSATRSNITFGRFQRMAPYSLKRKGNKGQDAHQERLNQPR